MKKFVSTVQKSLRSRLCWEKKLASGHVQSASVSWAVWEAVVTIAAEVVGWSWIVLVSGLTVCQWLNSEKTWQSNCKQTGRKPIKINYFGNLKRKKPTQTVTKARLLTAARAEHKNKWQKSVSKYTGMKASKISEQKKDGQKWWWQLKVRTKGRDREREQDCKRWTNISTSKLKNANSLVTWKHTDNGQKLNLPTFECEE